MLHIILLDLISAIIFGQNTYIYSEADNFHTFLYVQTQGISVEQFVQIPTLSLCTVVGRILQKWFFHVAVMIMTKSRTFWKYSKWNFFLPDQNFHCHHKFKHQSLFIIYYGLHHLISDPFSIKTINPYLKTFNSRVMSIFIMCRERGFAGKLIHTSVADNYCCDELVKPCCSQ